MKLNLRFPRNRWLVFAAGIVLGVLVVLGIRLVTYEPEHVHYHANFAVYINGQREEFKDPKYYQEVAICSATSGINLPEQRAHMHEDVNSIAHVHDHAVTWGQFFENLGWYVGPDFIETADGTLYRANDTEKLHLTIDGQDYTGLQAVTNMVIKDQSRVLVSFGDLTPETLEQEYKAVPSTAKQHDESKDPASCAGSEKIKFTDRLNHMF